jgi:hypothetical protein
LFDDLNIDTRNGLGDVYAKIAGQPEQAASGNQPSYSWGQLLPW